MYTQMPVVSSRYWNMVHGQTPEDVLKDEEGVQIMRVLGKNMAWLLKSIEAGKQQGVIPPQGGEKDQYKLYPTGDDKGGGSMYNLQLETFIVVADLGSFNKAAEALYITPPAVTKQINLLEKDLGLTLFVRTHRGLTLTEAGKSLYKDAKYIIQYCKESVERARKAMQEKDNVIRIGTSPMTPAAPLVQAWSKVQKQYPDIKLQMIPYMNSQESAREILKNLGSNIGGDLRRDYAETAPVRRAGAVQAEDLLRRLCQPQAG